MCKLSFLYFVGVRRGKGLTCGFAGVFEGSFGEVFCGFVRVRFRFGNAVVALWEAGVWWLYYSYGIFAGEFGMDPFGLRTSPGGCLPAFCEGLESVVRLSWRLKCDELSALSG
jgi:hypothetical protein